MASALALLLGSIAPSHALTPINTIGDWACAAETDRMVVARILVQIAGQDRPHMQSPFFVDCIEEAIRNPAVVPELKISEAAAGCVYMALIVFSDTG